MFPVACETVVVEEEGEGKRFVTSPAEAEVISFHLIRFDILCHFGCEAAHLLPQSLYPYTAHCRSNIATLDVLYSKFAFSGIEVSLSDLTCHSFLTSLTAPANCTWAGVTQCSIDRSTRSRSSVAHCCSHISTLHVCDWSHWSVGFVLLGDVLLMDSTFFVTVNSEDEYSLFRIGSALRWWKELISVVLLACNNQLQVTMSDLEMYWICRNTIRGFELHMLM